MLVSLSIQNLILIESLTIDFDNGLTSFTGETGAGKSIILDALMCTLGGRVNAKLMKDPDRNAVVCATFSTNETINSILEEIGLPSNDELILRRVIYPNSKNKAFINDLNVSISAIQKVGGSLVEICGQHDSKGLMDQSSHIDILDRYSKLDTLKIKNAFRVYIDLKNELEALQVKLEKAEIEKGYLASVIEDLEKIDPLENEEDQLAEKRKFLSEGAKIGKVLETSKNNLAYSDITKTLHATLHDLEKHESFFMEPIKSINSAVLEIEEAISQIDKIADEMDYNPTIMEQIEDRLFQLRSAARKYQTLPSLLPEFLQDKIAELKLINNSAEALNALGQKVNMARDEYMKLADEAHKIRESKSKILTQLINSELRNLKMEKAEFRIDNVVNNDEKYWTSKGYNSLSFCIKTNPGQPFSPLSKTASGGELSRLMLAIKIALTNDATNSTLIFDEIDTGISGAVSDAVGKKLSQLSGAAQVLVVTHQPQVAAYANTHLLVSKTSSDESTDVKVRKLPDSDRESEIARMLSGQEVSDESIAAARKMIKAAA